MIARKKPSFSTTPMLAIKNELQYRDCQEGSMRNGYGSQGSIPMERQFILDENC
jgi:hypothetical protein